MADVKKAVIPVAGLGTRFLPASKAVPKELVPIGTTPILQLVIDEAVKSGIREIILIKSAIKQSIPDYFSLDSEYCKELSKLNKTKMLDGIKNLISKIKITYIDQTNPKGLGDAILRAKSVVGNEPFLVLLPDILILSKTPCSSQLIEAFHTVNASINAAESVPKEKISSYGIYELESGIGKLRKAKRVIEKPSLEEAPSDISVVGRYLFTPEVFSILENQPLGKNGEIQLADAQNTLAKEGKMFAYLYDGFQIDTGDELGFLKANIYTAFDKYENETEEFIKWMKEKKNV